MPAAISNDAQFLQFFGRFRYPFATHAEHVGNQFLRHAHVVAGQAIQRKEKAGGRVAGQWSGGGCTPLFGPFA